MSGHGVEVLLSQSGAQQFPQNFAGHPGYPNGSRRLRTITDAVDQGRHKILVVDDQKLIADTLAEILLEENFQAVAAYDGWAALKIARSLQPDYLLCDVLMPGMNGVELAIAIRKMFPNAKIMLFSGQAGISEILPDGTNRGFDFELIAKPIHPLKLIERLREIS
jgi:CheY-like chemotaxis protein